MCSSYDPTTYAAYNQCISTNTTGGGGGSNSSSKNSTNSGGSGTQVNVAGIVAGILVPVFVIAIAIGAYFGYKKWK